ncbi:MAG: DUF4352 domain-containing protein [Candidatus Pacebacteria bacterium]|nr:DUF4352 domain-containing protein [Candidatus Paceibacterota bacterium]
MKKLLSIVFLFSLIVSFSSITPTVNAIDIPNGATIKTANHPDVYIVKYINGKQFKRLVLNPQVFESYGHLRWEDILIISQSEMDSFATSDLVRVDGQTDIYQLVPNGDVGTKTLLESTVGYDLDSAYTINAVDFGNYVISEAVEDIEIIEKNIGDEVELTTIKYTIHNVEEKKILSSEFHGPTIAQKNTKFVVIDMSITNITKSGFLFFPSDGFVLIDNQKRQFITYDNTIGSIDNYLNVRNLAPSIQERGFIVYNIPEDAISYGIFVGKAGTNEIYGIVLKD